MTQTRKVITPIIKDTYGSGDFVKSAIKDLVEKIDHYHGNGNDREEMIFHALWNWFPGGSTADACAAVIEKTLEEVER